MSCTHKCDNEYLVHTFILSVLYTTVKIDMCVQDRILIVIKLITQLITLCVQDRIRTDVHHIFQDNSLSYTSSFKIQHCKTRCNIVRRGVLSHTSFKIQHKSSYNAYSLQDDSLSIQQHCNTSCVIHLIFTTHLSRYKHKTSYNAYRVRQYTHFLCCILYTHFLCVLYFVHTILVL